MRLESGLNAVRMTRPGCQNASRMPPESISIFSVPKESNWNALRMPSESLDCRSNAAQMRLECSSNVPTRMHECISNAARIQLERPRPVKKNDPNAPQMHLDCCRNLFRCFQYVKNQTEMHFDCRRSLLIAARMRLECISNVPTRMPECISNASRMSPESISIFSVLKESNWNALRMEFECPECGSNAVRMSRMRFECSSNVPNASQMRLECSSNVPIAAQMRLECSLNVPTGIQGCITNAAEIYFDLLGTYRIQLECTSNGV